MAQWRKVIVSGSAAELSSLTLDTALPVAQGGIGATSLSDKAVLISQDSGTDAVGSLALTTNGSIIVGGTNGPAVEAASDVAGTGLSATTGDGTLVIDVDAAQTQITSVGTLNGGAISSGFGNIDNGTSTLNTGNATVDNFTNNSEVADSHITGSMSGSFSGDGSNLLNVVTDIDLLSELDATPHATEDEYMISDDGSEKRISVTNAANGAFALVSGDATIAAGGALTIAANAVEGSMLNSNTVDDTTIEINSNQLRAKTAAIADSGTALATADQIHTFYTAGGANLATALNTDLGGNFTIGNQSSDTATFSGGVVIDGNLDVNGSLTTIDSTNLRVADRFIMASSGSSSGDGGLIVATDGTKGTAFGYDDSAKRWSLTKEDDTAEDATSIDPRQYVVSVSGSGANPGTNPNDFGTSNSDRIGMMHVNTSDGTIWIYS